MLNRLKIITFALMLSACSTTAENNLVNKEAPILLNSKWREPAPSKLTLNFNFNPRDKSGIPSIPEYNSLEGLYSMGGMAGCNGAGAGYLQNGWNLISTGPGASTLMGCGRRLEAEDDRLADALARVRTFKITKRGRLILLDEKKRALLNLKPVTPK